MEPMRLKKHLNPPMNSSDNASVQIRIEPRYMFFISRRCLLLICLMFWDLGILVLVMDCGRTKLLFPPICVLICHIKLSLNPYFLDPIEAYMRSALNFLFLPYTWGFLND